MGGYGKSKGSVKRITAAERQRNALDLRKSGLGYQEIADKLGYASAAGAHKAITTALRNLVREPAEELLELEVARLDAMLSGIWAKAISGDTWSIDRALKIMERRAAMLGLDAPQKRQITGELVLKDFAERAALGAGLDPRLVLAEAERILAEAD